MSNVGNATHIAGVYDKLLFKLCDPEFPLRLLPPYQGATELMFQRFRAAMPEEWLPSGDYRVTRRRAVAVGETEVLQPGGTQLCRSLDDIREFALERNVWMAIENSNNLLIIKHFLGLFEPELVGVCYDSGQANLAASGKSHV